MNLSYNKLSFISKKFGENFYVFYPEKLSSNIHSLRKAFEKHFKVDIAYSLKTNYTPSILKHLSNYNIFPEIVSELELDIIENIGLNTDTLIVNGPIKTLDFFKRLKKYNNVIINLESISDLSLAKRIGNQTVYGLRCNFDMKLNSGKRSRFGVCTETGEFKQFLDFFKKNSLSYGLHIHLPMRDLKSFKKRALYLKKLIIENNLNLEFINIGGGMMSPISEKSSLILKIQKVKFEEYSKIISKILEPCKKSFKNNLIIEPGTALVANTFDYFCKIKEIKDISGNSIAQLFGSTFDVKGTVREIKLPIEVILKKPKAKTYNVSRLVGYTCIENDEFLISKPIKASANSFLKILNVGSYSISMKPPFINYAPPILSIQKGKIEVIKRRERINNILELYK